MAAVIPTQGTAVQQEPPGELYRLIAETVPLMVWTATGDGRLDFVNARILEYTGLTFAELHGCGWAALVHPDDRDRCMASWTRALRTGGRSENEMRLRRADGAFRWHHGSGVPLLDAQGRVSRWYGICIDIDDQIRSAERTERALRESTADVRRLMDRLVAAQESERRRVADDLHDLIGQNLTALGIDLTTLKQHLPAGADPACSERVDAMRSLVEKTIDAIRGVMTDLRPPALEEFGLAPALRWYVAEFSERTGMKASLSMPGVDHRLPRDAELALFRIAQEALTNAAKHSAGSAVHVGLSENAGRLRLSVEDDGRGFADPVGARRARRGGWGLPAMRERAEAHGGMLTIEFPGRGTRLVVEIPGPAG